MRLRLLHIDNDIVAIDKPIAMPTHAPQPDPFACDVVSLLKRQLGVEYVGVHQRLDADTSGVILFALRPESNAKLAEAFAGRHARKHYVALVHGIPSPPAGTIDMPLAPAPGGLRSVTDVDDRLAKPALTRYSVRSIAPDRSCALVDLHPKTGRTHQLRVHLAAIGAPIVGDALYDPGRHYPRLMLHAHALELLHPATGVALRLVAPLPVAFSDAIGAGLALDIERALRLALDRRTPLAGDASTTAYRLVNDEADGLPGIVVDRLGRRFVVNVRDPRARAPIDAALRDLLPDFESLQAIDDRDRQSSEPEAHEEVLVDTVPFLVTQLGGRPSPVLAYRETIGRVRHWCRGQLVLACGVAAQGLSLSALSSSEDLFVIERSRPALEWLARCVEHAGLAARPMGIVAGELHAQLERVARKGRRFGVVIVDVRAVAARAPRGEWPFERVIAGSLELVEPGGLAVLCSDDRRITRRAYRGRAIEAMRRAGFNGEIVATYGESRMDFPTMPGSGGALTVLAIRRA